MSPKDGDTNPEQILRLDHEAGKPFVSINSALSICHWLGKTSEPDFPVLIGIKLQEL